jgi:hypothetical protein
MVSGQRSWTVAGGRSMSTVGFFGTIIAWIFYGISLLMQFFVVGAQ